MQFPDLFLPDKPGQYNGGFCQPSRGLYNIVIDPIAVLKPQSIAVGNIPIPDSKIDKGGYAKKAYC
jgi:hypothetical protein